MTKITEKTPSDAVSRRGYTLAALRPVLALPTLWLWQHERARDHHERTDVATMVWTYVLTGTAGMTIAIALQFVLACSVGFLLFGSDTRKYAREFTKPESEIEGTEHRAMRREMSRSWQYWVFLLIFSFVMAGLVEEGLKYCILVLARRYGTLQHERDYISIAVASASGFATMENIGFVYGAYKGNESPGKVALTIVERTAVGILGHSMTAALIGVNVLARDVRHESRTLWQMLGLPVLLHGSSDFALFAISAYNGNIGWVHPRKGSTVVLTLGIVVGLQLALAGVLRASLQHYGISY